MPRRPGPLARLNGSGKELLGRSVSRAWREGDRRRAGGEEFLHIAREFGGGLNIPERKADQSSIRRPIGLERTEPIGKQTDHQVGRMQPIGKDPFHGSETELAPQAVKIAAQAAVA